MGRPDPGKPPTPIFSIVTGLLVGFVLTTLGPLVHFANSVGDRIARFGWRDAFLQSIELEAVTIPAVYATVTAALSVLLSFMAFGLFYLGSSRARSVAAGVVAGVASTVTLLPTSLAYGLYRLEGQLFVAAVAGLTAFLAAEPITQWIASMRTKTCQE